MTVSAQAPQLLLLLGGLATPFIAGRPRDVLLLLLAGLALLGALTLPEGGFGRIVLLGHELTLLRVDGLSRIFGIIFTLNACAALLYAFGQDDGRQSGPAMFYVAAALGAVFAGDLITLYVCWEVMAVASTFLILARRTDAAQKAAMRYVLIHLLGGLVLLLGVALHIRATGSVAFTALAERTPAAWLMLAGVLINAAAVPLSSWLSDAYPEATAAGGVFLSAYTTKTAVYALLRAFPGWEVLVPLGAAMVLYGVVYALFENDMRRILAYSIINQVGFMVLAVGLGTAAALNGAAAHAFCHILYKSLLWMSAGAVLTMTGKSRFTELGGLWRRMPWTMALGVVGALAFMGAPGTAAFVSKSLIIQAAADAHLAWAWLVLEVSSAAVFLQAGMKYPYFVFFDRDSGLTPREAGRPMLLAMGLLAALCIGLGLAPGPVLSLMPFPMEPHAPFSASKIVGQTQLLAFGGLAFFLLLPLLRPARTVSLEPDWFYRKGAALLLRLLDAGLNGLNAACARRAAAVLERLAALFADLPERLAASGARLAGRLAGRPRETREADADLARRSLAAAAVPVGVSLLLIIFGLAALLAVVSAMPQR